MREERIAKISLTLLLVGTFVMLAVATAGRLARAGSGKRPPLGSGMVVPNKQQESPGNPTDPGTDDEGNKTLHTIDDPPADETSRQSLFASLTIFVLAIFLGYELITKVPPTLHTPLMSGSNAISGITIVGAIVVTGVSSTEVASMIGFLAVIMATINCVGGFLVTHRMLAMFAKPK